MKMIKSNIRKCMDTFVLLMHLLYCPDICLIQFSLVDCFKIYDCII